MTPRRCKTRVILGPPGTGKTTRLVSVARDLCAPEDQKQVLFVSHTVAAAKEIGARCGMPGAEARTLHSVCYRLLGLTHAQVVDFSKLRLFGKILSLDTDEDGWVLDALGVLAMADSTGKSMLDAYMSSNRLCGWSDVEYVCNAYLQWKKENGFIDFSDMLTRASRIKPESPWTKLFVDEAQDFSPVAWSLVRDLAKRADLVVVAGDDDQAIYEWSGADPHGVDAFINEFKSGVEVLEKSYRVPRVAHVMAQCIIKRLSRRIPKAYDAADREGSHMSVGSIDALGADALHGAVVLYRDKTMRSEISAHLTELGLRFTMRPMQAPYSPYDGREARALRIMAKLRSGRTMTVNENKLLHNTLSDAARIRFTNGGIDAIAGLRAPQLFDRASNETLEYLDRVDVSLPPEVTVSTIHGFKGAEHDKVVLCTAMSDRASVALSNNPDPEHRVWYVGVTRTKDKLITVGGENEYQI